MGFPELQGPIRRMLLFSTTTSCRSASATMWIGSVPIPGIDETLEVVGDAKGEAPLGDVLPDHVLVQVGDQGLGGWDRGETGFLGGSLRRRGWLWNGLGSDLGEGSGCAEGANACRESKPPSKERDVLIEAEVAAEGWSSDMETPKSEAIRTTHDMWSNTPLDGVSY